MKTWKVGDKLGTSMLINDTMNEMFGAMSGDRNPVHFDSERMAKTHFKRRVANGIQGISCIGASIVKMFVTDETIVVALEQHNTFLKPIFVGDTIYSTVEVEEVQPNNTYWLQCFIKNAETFEILTSARFRVRVIEA